jgi:hypothetical protein
MPKKDRGQYDWMYGALDAGINSNESLNRIGRIGRIGRSAQL